MRLVRTLLIFLFTLYLIPPAPAGAQTLVTGFLGGAVDHDTLAGVRSVYGVSAGYWSRLPVGAEVDFGFYPNYFPPEHPDGDHHVVGSISTLAVNLLVGVPFGANKGVNVRPYFTGGLALYQIHADEPSSLFDVRGTDAGYDLGGGAIVMLGEHIGLRGDVRYMKDSRERVTAIANDPVHGRTVAFGAFSFTRTTAGFVWRF